MKALLPLVAALGLAACSKDNPYYCESNPDHNCTLDAGGTEPDSTTACASDDTCGGTTPACNLTTNECVQCTDSNATACGGTTPICGANVCHGCAINADCVSGACMPDGSCAAPDTVLFAAPGTPAGTTCTAADKCTLEAAITAADTTKKVIVLDPGAYTTTGSVAIAKDVTLLARDAAIVKGGAGDGPVFNVTSGGDLTVYYADIKNGDGDTLGSGITCMGGTLTVSRASIHHNAANGINTTACAVSIDRSTIYSNTGGGILVSATTSPKFTITNNFLYLNGSNSLSKFGGIKLEVSSFPTGSVIEFNTLVDNVANSIGGYAGGMVCIASGFTAANNIIVHNAWGTSTSNAESNVSGNCTHASSIVQESPTELAFASTSGTYNLRIGASSIAKDVATTTSTVKVDFEGDDRPQNGISDCGADEFK